MSLATTGLVVLAIALLTARSTCLVTIGGWLVLQRRRPWLAGWSPLAVAVPPLAGIAAGLAVWLPANPIATMLLGPYHPVQERDWHHLSSLDSTENSTLLLSALAVVLALGMGPARRLWRVARGCASARAMLRRSSRQADGLMEADLDTPNAVAIGLLRPVVLVSRTWWGGLSGLERRIVVAHEHAHVRRRDPLTLALLLVLGAVAPRRSMERVVSAWEDHAEQQADIHAAVQIGDAVAVAEALLTCHRRSSLIPGFTTAWTGGRLERRVVFLLEAALPPCSEPRPDVDLPAVAVLALLALAILAIAPGLHWLLELMINGPL